MRYNKIVPAVAVAALLVSAAACDKGLTDVNKNPNAPEQVPPQNLLANAELTTVGGGTDVYGVEGIWYNLYLAEGWAQQTAELKYNDEDNYIPRPTQLSGIWSATYAGPLKDLDQVKRYAAQQGSPAMGAVADVLQQLNFQMLTDTYGDIPYTEALKGDSAMTAPAFDTQKDVYYGMLSHLATDVTALTGSAGAWASGDFIYGGSLSNWRMFANSLRMRMAMRISNVDPTHAAQEFAAAYAAGGFASNNDNAVFHYGASQPDQNPYYDYWFNQNRNGDFGMSAAMVDSLSSHQDPRLQVYAAPNATGYNGGYWGLQNGNLPGDFGKGVPDVSSLGSSFLAPDAPSYVMTYAEVLFLEAEAAARGYIPGGAAAAASFYNQGVTASFTQYGLSASAAAAYLALPQNAYNGLTSIYYQKWVALFGNGPEAWAEVRRTGYPQLTPAPGFSKIPNRLTYPSEEQLLNGANWQTAVSRSGGKSLFDKMWWQG